jgi:serpin B
MVSLLGAPTLTRVAPASSESSGPAHVTKHPPSSSTNAAATAAARLGFDLYSLLRGAPDDVFISPISIEMALAMAGEGAAGETAKQMRAVLHLSGGPSPDFGGLGRQLSPADTAYDLVIANALWGDRGTSFEPRYLDRVKSGYGAELNQVDFADPGRASATINDWVGNRTHDLIRDLISPGAITPRIKLILTNAVYFKGRWADAFDQAQTADQDFMPLQGPKLRTPLMQITRQYRYAESARAQVLELPYAGGGLSMLVVLPRRPADLDTVEQQLTFEGVKTWLARLGPRLVEVHLPRFRLETQYALEQTLPRLGMRNAFDAGRADFSGMDGRRELYIGLVTHKAFVEVNEKGTTAAAATGVIMPTALIRPAEEAPVVFRADHPFVFLIRDARTGAVLFVGRLSRPAA